MKDKLRRVWESWAGRGARLVNEEEKPEKE